MSFTQQNYYIRSFRNRFQNAETRTEMTLLQIYFLHAFVA
ncbi:MAG: hypothetical protein OJF59_001311 [Cytophagales bacterium]|nr:MAG: hypothetical protein OJF59_001311 [Cytophagales bacterium]